ncbi:MAG: CDP-diacylglycerol--glycerol-3-phosphate 3-phosphatidyltransferase [Actinomyces ruminicola]|uniref:CDP-diacylglycerol--glycerol-3-phosphate 3-phosphatidyltransferase n=2 Tax=Actinomyces ruminicola TaxID=332524 RepID=A0A1G9TZ99_9ACTO|nr:CDP-diacylglycerol--glycerol-3-phosphate 3-phosphatidyltransferase [Actinomyces ruminicola]SDM52921.1 CDP-diacylglycerol--glycerol-3-phosphate 3-phosphatidyltransferase [Actinomyces ruminicola]
MSGPGRTKLTVMNTKTPIPPERSAPLLNVANALTVLRLILVPVFVWLMLQPGDPIRLLATAVFIVAAITDRLDGQLARSRNLITSFGKIADPIADKALTLSAFILLSVDGRLWWWVTIVIIVRELGITLLRFIMLRRAVMAASRGGKLKTTLQMIGIIGLLTPWALFLPDALATVLTALAYAAIGAALVVTVVTGVDYVLQARRIARAEEAA